MTGRGGVGWPKTGVRLSASRLAARQMDFFISWLVWFVVFIQKHDSQRKILRCPAGNPSAVPETASDAGETRSDNIETASKACGTLSRVNETPSNFSGTPSNHSGTPSGIAEHTSKP